ncbi:MAG: hypothetical protein IT365_07255 [Candidatus Hydrogenedentes bacterium]|nr:hypothetical protein [Candidatus Hydrogenedentota bacterium]
MSTKTRSLMIPVWTTLLVVLTIVFIALFHAALTRPTAQAEVRNEESTRALFEAFLMSERSLTMLPGNMDLGWKDIPTLLKLAEDTSLVDTKNRTFGRMLLTEIPAKPFTGDPQSWAVRGMISLWVIEGIRCGYGASFRPPLYGFCFKDDLTQAQCEASDIIHKEALAAYQKWWDAVRELPIEEAPVIDPLLGTGLRWCVPQQPRPPTAASSQPEPRPDAAVPASPITGLPEPPFTIEEVAAYHHEKTGTDLPIDKLKQLYTNIVLHDYGKGGDISGIKDDARRALAFEQDQLTRLQLYLGLSDGYYVQPDTPWQTQRKNLARVLLTGLREVLQLDLPDEPPKIPTASFYDIHVPGPNRERVMQKFQKKHDEEIAAQQKARKIRDLIDCRTRFTRRLISEYNYRERSPAAYEELYNLALEYLGDETTAKQLREAAESYQGLKSPVPIIRLPSGNEKKQTTPAAALSQDRVNALELIRAGEGSFRNAQFKMESQVYQRSPEGELVASDQFSKVEGLIAPGVRARYHVEFEAAVPAVVKRESKLELSTSHDRMEVSFDGTTQTVRSDSLQESTSTTPRSWQGQRGYIALFSNRLTHVLPLYEAMGLSAYLATIPDEAPEWKIVPSDDASRLTVWFPRASYVPEGLQDKMSYLVTLDLARGGNIVDWKWYLDYDSERPQLMAALEDVRLEQIEGVWLPVHFIQREYRYDPASAGNSVQEETRTAIEWSHVNAELDPDAFRIVYPVLPESYWILAHLVLPKDWSPTQQLEVLETVTDYQQIASTEMGKSRYACRFVIPSNMWEHVIDGVRAAGRGVSTYTDEDTASFDERFPKQESWWKDSEGNPVTLEWWNPESVHTPKRIGWQEHWPNTPRKWVTTLYGQVDTGDTLVYVRVWTD